MIIREGQFGRVEVTSSGSFLFVADGLPSSVVRGNPIRFGATLVVEDGFDSAVTLEILGLPAGVVPVITTPTLSPGQRTEIEIPTGAVPANSALDLGWRGTEVV